MFGLSPKRKLEKYFARHPEIKTIVIAGDFGRTSAIRAVGQVLGQEFVVSLGVDAGSEEIPDIVILDFQSTANFPDIIPDFTVITSAGQISDDGGDSRTKYYFELANKSRQVLINRRDIPQEYSQYLTNPNIATYGDQLPSNYYFETIDSDLSGRSGNFIDPEGGRLSAHIHVLGDHNIRPITMAVALARFFKIPPNKITIGVASIHPLPGHLSVGKGLNNSVILDDSTTNSPLSIELALRTVYALNAPSRILVTDYLNPSLAIDRSLISEVLVLNSKTPPQSDPMFHIFKTELDLLDYLATRLEPGGIVLLKIPLPAITVAQVL